VTEGKTSKPPAPVTTAIWHVATVQPGMDDRVNDDLAGQGYFTHLPQTFRRVVVAGRAQIVAELRLSPYVFVAIDMAPDSKQSVQAVRDTLGVASVVSMALNTSDGIKYPSTVGERTILGLKRDEARDRAEARKPPSKVRECPYRKDQEVVVTAHGHAFEGMRGRVHDTRSNSVTVLMGISNIPIWFDIGEVSPTGWVERRRA
jgi:transcription antitermination factor NusG